MDVHDVTIQAANCTAGRRHGMSQIRAVGVMCWLRPERIHHIWAGWMYILRECSRSVPVAIMWTDRPPAQQNKLCKTAKNNSHTVHYMHAYNRMSYAAALPTLLQPLTACCFEYVHNMYEKLTYILAWTKNSQNIASIVTTPYNIQCKKEHIGRMSHLYSSRLLRGCREGGSSAGCL